MDLSLFLGYRGLFISPFHMPETSFFLLDLFVLSPTSLDFLDARREKGSFFYLCDGDVGLLLAGEGPFFPSK